MSDRFSLRQFRDGIRGVTIETVIVLGLLAVAWLLSYIAIQVF